METFAVYCTGISIACFLFAAFLRRITLRELNKKPILITGCDSGFGRRLAIRLDGKGVPVYAACLLAKSTEELRQCCSTRLKAVLLDVTDSESIQSALQFVKRDLGDTALWAVVNNAGVFGDSGPFEWVPKEQCKKTMDVNLWGMYDVTQAFLPLIRRGNQGRIVNMSSAVGRISFSVTGYNMSKYAVEAFSDGLSYEIRHCNITVHVIEPGGFKTSIAAPENLKKQYMASFQRANPEIRKAYGGEKYIESLSNWASRANRNDVNIDKVVDAYEHALLAKYPQNRYQIGLDCKLFFYPLSFFPLKLQMLAFVLLCKLKRNEQPLPMKE